MRADRARRRELRPVQGLAAIMAAGCAAAGFQAGAAGQAGSVPLFLGCALVAALVSAAAQAAHRRPARRSTR